MFTPTFWEMIQFDLCNFFNWGWLKPPSNSAMSTFDDLGILGSWVIFHSLWFVGLLVVLPPLFFNTKDPDPMDWNVMEYI